MDREVELHSAYVWDCDNCGTENFERPFVKVATDEEASIVREAFDVEIVEVKLGPGVVVCRKCGGTFKVSEVVREA